MVPARQGGIPLNKAISGLYACTGNQKVFLDNKNWLTEQVAGEHWLMGASAQTKLSEANLKPLRQDVLIPYVYLDGLRA